MRANKKIFLIMLIIFLQSYFLYSKNVTGKTVLKHGENSLNLVFENSMNSYFINKIKVKNKKNKIKRDNLFISGSVFYEESCRSKDLSKYFFPNGKTELIIKGYNAAGGDRGGIAPDPTINPNVDFYAEWLGIPSSGDLDNRLQHNFSSKIKISPIIKKTGTTIYFQKTFSKNVYISLLVPVAQVKTNMQLQEYDVSGRRVEALVPVNGGLYFEEPLDATQAFAHPLMQYGKIDNKVHKLTGLSDIIGRIGYTKIFRKMSIDFYGSLVIPTSYKPEAKYLFEPFVGNGGHLGVGAGINLATNFYKNFYFLTTLDYQYLFKNTEKRSFDLRDNGPWSRYMAATTGLPRTRPQRLINYLTKDLNVTPGSNLNWIGAFHWNKNWFSAEIGTDFEYKAKESVVLKDGFTDMVSIATYEENTPQSLISNNRYLKSYSTAKSNNSMIMGDANIDFSGANIRHIIQSSELDLNSCKHPDSWIYKLYGSLGVEGKINGNKIMLNSGAAYNFAPASKYLETWDVWLQLNLSI